MTPEDQRRKSLIAEALCISRLGDELARSGRYSEASEHYREAAEPLRQAYTEEVSTP
ncbi:MAG TPA: hypothetical protein VF234_08010 [Limnochordia bacterium]